MVETVPLFERFKTVLVGAIGIDADGCHIYIGLLLFMSAAIAFRKKGVRAWMLIPVLFSSILGEVFDAFHQMHALGYWEWNKSLMDIFNTNLMPVALYFLLKLRLLTGTEQVTPLSKQALD